MRRSLSGTVGTVAEKHEGEVRKRGGVSDRAEQPEPIRRNRRDGQSLQALSALLSAIHSNVSTGQARPQHLPGAFSCC